MTNKDTKQSTSDAPTGGFGGLAEVTGEVRRGSPSGYGGIPARFRENLNTPSTPMGYGELSSLRETAALSLV